MFDEHRVRLDLTAAEREIYEHAARLWEIDSTLVAPTGNDPAVTTQWTHHRSALDEAWETLIDRVAALHTYREGGLRPHREHPPRPRRSAQHDHDLDRTQ